MNDFFFFFYALGGNTLDTNGHAADFDYSDRRKETQVVSFRTDLRRTGSRYLT
jgi:hypothetical protein